MKKRPFAALLLLSLAQGPNLLLTDQQPREVAQQRCQFPFLHQGGRRPEVAPAEPALALFRPLVLLPLDRQHEYPNQDLTGEIVVLLEVAIAADRPARPEPALETGLLIGFALGGAGRSPLAHRPAFGNDPSPRAAGGEQK